MTGLGGPENNEDREGWGAGEMLGKLMEETGEMEQGKGRDVGRKRAEKTGGRVEERWGERQGEVRIKKWGEREEGRGTGTWGAHEGDSASDRGGERGSRRPGDVEEEKGSWERRNWDTQGVPEMKGNQIPMWTHPSTLFPLGFKNREEEAAGRQSWGGWPSQSPSFRPPETTLTRLPRMQQEVEPLGSSTVGNPGMHKDAGDCAFVREPGGGGPSSELSVAACLATWP